YVQRNVLLWIFSRQEEHLGDHQIRNIIVDRRSQENNVLFEQPGINIEGALAARGLLHHHGYKIHAFSCIRRYTAINIRSETNFEKWLIIADHDCLGCAHAEIPAVSQPLWIKVTRVPFASTRNSTSTAWRPERQASSRCSGGSQAITNPQSR